MPVQRDAKGNPIPRVVSRQPGPPPSGGGQAPAGGTTPMPAAGGQGGSVGGGLSGGLGPPQGTGGSIGGSIAQLPGSDRAAATSVAKQTAQNNVAGATPFMETPGMRIASQRISGDQVANDPAISAALTDFNNRVAPQLQNRSTLSGLGRSTAALNANAQAQASMLPAFYESAFGREGDRLNRMGSAAENELGRGERSATRVADANQNMANLLMQMSNTQQGRDQATGQNLMQAGGTFRDIAQQGNAADLNDFLRRQALGEQAVYAPFGGLASAGMGSTSSTTGK